LRSLPAPCLQARGWEGAQIAGRLAAQWPAEEKVARADFVVWSEGSLAAHAAQVDRLLATLGLLAA
ncbi:MAG TPA: hypothetical protein PKE47_00080, partial [Verrucomicrobiota bacterium]|nr:hypothetical protein [Verrucomicrobiota bacterium]